MPEKSWFVYIIKTVSGKYYTGITTDVKRRFNEHKNLKKGAKYLKANPPKEIVYQEECENRSVATKREIEIKKMNKSDKQSLIEN